MAYLSYQGRTRAGKANRGKISAETKRDAIAQVKQQGIDVFSIKKLNGVLYKEIEIGSKIKNRDFIIFLRQLSTLIHAGIPIIEATTIMEDQMDNKYFKQALRSVSESIEAGQSLSNAIASYPKIFPKLLINMVHAGEISGDLDEILDSMATYYEKQYQL